MALNIKNPEVERLAADVAKLAHETKTEAIRRALAERKLRLQVTLGRPERVKQLKEYFEREVWPKMPQEALGRTITKEQEEEILGLGPEGV